MGRARKGAGAHDVRAEHGRQRIAVRRADAGAHMVGHAHRGAVARGRREEVADVVLQLRLDWRDRRRVGPQPNSAADLSRLETNRGFLFFCGLVVCVRRAGRRGCSRRGRLV